MSRNMTARAAAKAAGSKTYETGVPCKHGHMAPRATISGACTACTALAVAVWADKNKHKQAGYQAAYRQRLLEASPDTFRQHRNAYAREWRAANKEQFRGTCGKRYRELVASTEGRDVRYRNRLTAEEVVQRLQQVHGGVLQYVGGYESMDRCATFMCIPHSQVFDSIPHNVLRGANPCTQCNHMKSAGEDEVARYLGAFTTVVRRDRSVIGPKELDIYLPELKLAVEYCGMYWHSCGDKEETARHKRDHEDKHKLCEAAGVRLITLFEDEWVRRNYAIRRLLRNAVGASRGRLMARKCALKKVSNAEARGFYDRYHPQGGDGNGDHYALFWGGKMVACMRFTVGANDRGAAAVNRAWTLSRYATRITVAGGASRLFKAFIDDRQPSIVKSFSDNRFFGGGMYAALGFVLEEELPADYQIWSQKLGMLPKSHYQRRNIPKRLTDHKVEDTFDPSSDQRTEAEMTYLMGARRIYDCGKKRWVWNAH